MEDLNKLFIIDNQSLFTTVSPNGKKRQMVYL